MVEQSGAGVPPQHPAAAVAPGKFLASARAGVKPVQTWTTASAAAKSMALNRGGILERLDMVARRNPDSDRASRS
jgi:hypothetical protein